MKLSWVLCGVCEVWPKLGSAFSLMLLERWYLDKEAIMVDLGLRSRFCHYFCTPFKREREGVVNNVGLVGVLCTHKTSV